MTDNKKLVEEWRKTQAPLTLEYLAAKGKENIEKKMKAIREKENRNGSI
jgi:hypothetical protein